MTDMRDHGDEHGRNPAASGGHGLKGAPKQSAHRVPVEGGEDEQLKLGEPMHEKPKPTDEGLKLSASLAAKQAECNELRDALMRKQAEFENYRKRMVREQTQFLERATERLVVQLLPIIDNLERAMSAAEEQHDLEQLAGGVSMVHSQVVDLFGKEGIEIIDPLGGQFDPNLHHAMMQVNNAEQEDGTIVEVVQKGYSLKGKIIRPAMVNVSVRPAQG